MKKKKKFNINDDPKTLPIRLLSPHSNKSIIANTKKSNNSQKMNKKKTTTQNKDMDNVVLKSELPFLLFLSR